VLEGLDSVDRLWIADKHQLDSPSGAPSALPGLLPLLRRLRAERYDQLLLLHHLTTTFGTAKYALLCAAIAPTRTVGLDNGRGRFLDVRVPDAGFGERHEVDYCLEVAVAAGATRPTAPRLEIALSAADHAFAADAVPEGAIALHAGGGPYSLARRWPAENFALVAMLLSGKSVEARMSTMVGQPTSVAGPFDAAATSGAKNRPTGWPGLRPGIRAGGWAAPQALSPRSGAPFIILGTAADEGASHKLMAAPNRPSRQLTGRDEAPLRQECAAALEGVVLNLTGRTTVKQAAAVLARCKLLISNDSGVVHLAAAVGTPVVAVFGPSNDGAWGPYPPAEHRVVRATLPCSPCFYRGKSLGTPQGCPTRECLQLVTPEMVAQAAEQLLAKSE